MVKSFVQERAVCYNKTETEREDRCFMKKRNTKEIFAETLLELAEHKTIDKITVKQITEGSGLSLQTFYNHFLDKADLVLWIHMSKAEQFLQKLGKNGYTFGDYLLDNVRFYAEHKAFLRNAFVNTHGQDSYAARSAERGCDMLLGYLRSKGIPETEEIRFYLRMYAYAAVHMVAEWTFQRKEMPPEVFAKYLEGGMPETLKKILHD